jgi:hypothetical protein
VPVIFPLLYIHRARLKKKVTWKEEGVMWITPPAMNEGAILHFSEALLYFYLFCAYPFRFQALSMYENEHSKEPCSNQLDE